VDFDLTREQEMIRKEVRKFAQSEIAPVALELDEAEAFSSDLTRKMGEIGLFGMFVREIRGSGHGLYLLHHRRGGDCPGGRLPGGHHCGGQLPGHRSAVLLRQRGTEAEIPAQTVQRGEGLWGFGLTEPTAGSDAGGSKTTAVRDGNEWVINGSKIFITNAASDMTLGVTVQAITGTRPNGKPEYTCFIVESGTRGSRRCP
jgi:short/branched chain acyl-CoA dehydrogenase